MKQSFSHQAQRVAIFIDVQNLYHSAKNLFKAKVNFENIVKAAIKNRTLLRIFAYVVKTEDTPGETAFFEALKKLGIELRIKDLQVYPGGFKKGDWDVGLTVDAIRLASSVDAVVLVTGDGDFVPLVEYLQAQGKFVEVMAFSKSASSKLKEQADNFIDLSERPRIFLLSNF